MELRGYELVENLFVDNSRMGADNEPALTVSQFEKRVAELLKEYGALIAKITSEGQFQVYVGLFRKIGISKTKKIGNNTYRIDMPDGYAIRLHDTNVLTFQGDNVILNDGSYSTVTTKARMNEYLPDQYRIIQRNFHWYIFNSKTQKEVPYENGMTLKV